MIERSVSEPSFLGSFRPSQTLMGEEGRELQIVIEKVEERLVESRAISNLGGYDTIRERLASFKRGTRQARENAWCKLSDWRRSLRDAGGPDLPPPLVFTTDEGYMEFEWRLPGRELVLTLVTEDICEYFLTIDEKETEADVSTEEVLPLLRRIIE